MIYLALRKWTEMAKNLTKACFYLAASCSLLSLPLAVSRIVAQSEKHGVLLLLDVNTEIYPMHPKDKFLLVLSPTLEWSRATATGKRGQVEQKSLADKFEYIMHGLLYKMSTVSSESSKGKLKASDEGSKTDVKVEVYASFGGLQMMLKGDPLSCTKFTTDQNLFLLIRKLM